MSEEKITRVTYRWDEDGFMPGWYCQSYAGDRLVDDSQKVWYPVDAEDYSLGDSDKLRAALAEAFPGAAIDKMEGR